MQLQMRVGSGKQARCVDAVLTVHHAKSQHKECQRDGWKCALTYQESRKTKRKRYCGTWRHSIVNTVENLLSRLSHRIAGTETSRLLTLAAAMQARRTRNLITVDSGSQPSLGRPSLALTPARARETSVHCVHQIYGLFRDGKPMSDLFEDSHRKWSEVATRMGAKYHLWDVDEVESLMKHEYTKFWRMYQDVRYPVMRADIARIAILHRFGGLYSDLDVKPNRCFYTQSEFGLARVSEMCPKSLPKKVNGKLLSAKRNKSGAQWKTWLDMEVIVGTAGNPIFIDWLKYIRKQIPMFKYKKKGSCYNRRKMRYIWHTTGPHAMNRFLKTPVAVEKLRGFRHLECNSFKDVDSMNDSRMRHFDVISFESMSYKTDEVEIRVPVGLGEKALPILVATKRMRSKCGVLRMGEPSVTSGTMALSQVCVAVGQESGDVGQESLAVGQESDAREENRVAHSQVGDDVGQESLAVAEIEADNHLEHAAEDLDRERINELRSFVKGGMGQFPPLQNLPLHLRAWLLEDEDLARRVMPGADYALTPLMS
jgi:hypothetical protein